MTLINGDLYPGQDPETFNQWFEITHDLFKGIPFKMHIAKLESGQQPIRDLVMDPLPTLQGKGEAGLALEGVTDKTRVTTTIHDHERSLNLRAILLVAVTDLQDDGSVAISSHKQKPNG